MIHVSIPHCMPEKNSKTSKVTILVSSCGALYVVRVLCVHLFSTSAFKLMAQKRHSGMADRLSSTFNT